MECLFQGKLGEFESVELEVRRKLDQVVDFQGLENAVKSPGGEFDEIEDEDANGGLKAEVVIAATDLRGVVSSPVEKAPLAEAWVRSRLHFKVDVFASRELDADIEDDASVILGFFGRLRI